MDIGADFVPGEFPLPVSLIADAFQISIFHMTKGKGGPLHPRPSAAPQALALARWMFPEARGASWQRGYLWTILMRSLPFVK